MPDRDTRNPPLTKRARFYDARQVLALAPYMVGAIIWVVAAGLLILADKIGASKHSEHLIG